MSRLLIPSLALTEYGEDCTAADVAPGTIAYECYRPLGERVLELFSESAECGSMT